MTLLLDSNLTKMDSRSSQQRDVQWADGLRGIAAFFVIISHCLLAFLPGNNSPAEEDGTVRPLQMPFLRLLGSGHTCVSLFFLLSGFVCSLKPLRLARSYRAEEARSTIASSAFRRMFRLVIPATAATVLAFVLAQLNAFHKASAMGNQWLHDTSPLPVAGFYAPIKCLFMNCINTWSNGANRYDLNQWTMGFEMRGSVLIFITLFSTMSFTPSWRLGALCVMALYFYISRDLLSGFTFYAGAILADISLILGKISLPLSPNLNGHSTPRFRICESWPIGLAILALFIGGFPDRDIDRMAWSRFLASVGYWIFPAGGEMHRGMAVLSSVLLVIAILYSPVLKRQLSHPYLVFLGSISFPMYLLHGTLIRTVLVWLLYGVIPQQKVESFTRLNEDGEIVTIAVIYPESFVWKIARPMAWIGWTALVIFLSVLWKNRIDSLSVRVGKTMEEVMMGKRPLFTPKENDTIKKDSLKHGNGDLEKGQL